MVGSLKAETDLHAIDPVQPPAVPPRLAFLLASYPSHVQRGLGSTAVCGLRRWGECCATSYGTPETSPIDGAPLGMWVDLIGHFPGLGYSLHPVPPMYLERSTFDTAVGEATASGVCRRTLLVKRNPWI